MPYLFKQTRYLALVAILNQKLVITSKVLIEILYPLPHIEFDGESRIEAKFQLQRILRHWEILWVYDLH